MRYVLNAPPVATAPVEDDLAKLLTVFAKECDSLAAKLDDGMSIDEWRAAFEELIMGGHRDAYGYGVRRSSGADPLAEVADEVARAVRDLESYYLTGFENDLQDGNVTDPARRMSMYGGRMRGTANGGWVDGCDDTETFTWVLGAVEDHCEDCPVLAEASPYDKANLPTTPGANNTPCLFNCTCKLTRNSDGQGGFDRIPIWDSKP